MKVAARTVRRPALILAILALGLAGIHAYREMPRQLEPEVAARHGVVDAWLPGVNAAELEEVLTEPIEKALLALPEVLECRSETQDGVTLIVTECEARAARSGAAWSSIEARLERLRSELSADFIGLEGPYLRRPEERWAEALITLARPDGADQAPVEQALLLAERLERCTEVAHLEQVGLPREQIVLSYDDKELAGTGMTPLKLREYLRAQHITTPGAYFREDGSIAPVETVSRIRDFSELERLPVRDPSDGRPVALSRLLDVKRKPLEPAIDRVTAAGRRAIALAVYRAEGVSIEAFAQTVRAAVAEFRRAHPESCELLVFQPEMVEQEIGRFRVNLLQSFVAIVVLLLLVLGLRAGLAVAVVLPFVVLSSFVILGAAGFGLDAVTMSSFILVLGLLVDNHTVAVERIQRLKQMGEAHAGAVRRASRELLGPLLAAAATTAAGFLPVVLTGDPVGEYVDSLFWVVLISLSVSLTFCFLVTPLLLSRARPRASTRTPLLEEMYKRILARSFPLFIPLVLLVGGLCFGGYQLLKTSDQIFFPASSRALWLLEVEFPHGTELARTAQVTSDLDSVLNQEKSREDSALSHFATFIGRSAPQFQASIPYREFAPHYAQVLLKLDPDRSASDLSERLREWMALPHGGARLRLRPVRLGAQLEWPIRVEISGKEEAILAAGAEVSKHLEETGLVNVSCDWERPIAKLRVLPNREALAEKDLTVADLSAAMHTVIHGLPLFDLRENGRRIPVLLRARSARANWQEALADAYVYPEKGDAALLYEVAESKQLFEYPVRGRKHGMPCITVRAETSDPDRALRQEIEIDGWLGTIREAHPELSFEVAGLSAAAERANRAILDKMPWALLLVLLCLLLQSRSLIDTALILLTIPLSFTGVAFGLLLSGQPFSFMTLVGMTALAGIVVNNAIVLLASIRSRLEENGEASREVLIESAAHRLRPILLTSLCALASMAVLYHSGGPMWRPLAIAVISGLAFATALVLFVLPVLYGVILRVKPGVRGAGSTEM
ncbi:MAG: efflux RND transporter permease subunit [Planctomycetota bacterium]